MVSELDGLRSRRAGAVDAAAMRHALGHFGSGLTVITGYSQDCLLYTSDAADE